MVLTEGTCGDASSSRFSAAPLRGRYLRRQPPGKVYRIGFLWDSPNAFLDALEAFRQGLRELGYVEGRTITIEYRWAEGKPERMRELAEELVRLKVDLIVAPSSIYTEAAKRATSTIPIIFVSHATRSAAAMWRALRGRAATSPASP